MRLTLHSRKLRKDFCFWMPDNGGYIRLEDDDEGKIGTLAPQICARGEFSGDTLCATPKSYAATCRKWLTYHIQRGQ